MAKTPVTLKVDGFTDREVMMVKYAFNQAVDVEGQMAGIPRGGLITLRIKAMNDGNPDMLKWMTSANLNKNGSIEFIETVKGGKMKTIEFTDAYCIDFIELWEEGKGHSEEIIISCRTIKNGPVKYENQWA